MQNDLNSLLIEGVVDGSPILETVDGEARASFTILCRRYIGERPYTVPIDVVAYGKLAEKAAKKLHEGMTSRIVGPLRNSPLKEGAIAVVAKHLEYKDEKGSRKEMY